MYRVTCNQCGASVVTPGTNTDALNCGCCAERHSHEVNANNCPGHPGEHGLGVAGCTVCRPCTITLELPVRVS